MTTLSKLEDNPAELLQESLVVMRQRLGLSQKELDDIFSVAPGTVNRYENTKTANGEPNPYGKASIERVKEFYTILKTQYDKYMKEPFSPTNIKK